MFVTACDRLHRHRASPGLTPAQAAQANWVVAVADRLPSMQRRRQRLLVASLPEMIESLSRSLRTGASLQQALEEASQHVGPAAAELRSVVATVRAGAPLTEALRKWSQSTAVAEVRVVASTLGLLSENHAGSAHALSGVAQTLRNRAGLRDEVRALTSQASASMQALVFLPVLFLALDALGDGAATTVLLSPGLGRVCVVAGVALNLVGWFWMRSITHRHGPT